MPDRSANALSEKYGCLTCTQYLSLTVITENIDHVFGVIYPAARTATLIGGTTLSLLEGRALGEGEKQHPPTYHEFKLILAQVLDAARLSARSGILPWGPLSEDHCFTSEMADH